MPALYIIAEHDENYQIACYYGGAVDTIDRFGQGIRRTTWCDEDLALRYEDKAEADRYAEDLASYAWSKGWPIRYTVETVGQ